ncbi:glycosyltransferase family protein [Microbacterium sp. IEGM 1404]|uniref:glycosyltransferase family protein n=1 Tax=Microbacterium sp. IEGM 1404 TaxID=3047084 RepID=UPI0024B78503|nr:glycosyltransferase [Microbacterium sp. IEGM 1404]MDI9892080.1 hypothetical protein [Microbacterium sp. IEGM 1404]
MRRRARAILRRARSSSVLAPLVVAADRWWWARTIRRADVVDLEFVVAQGGPPTASRAVRAYVRGGFRSGFALNPLFMERLVSSQLPDAGRVPALYAYLANDVRGIEASVVWDAPAYATRNPDSPDDRGSVLGHAWRRARQEGVLEVSDGERTSWDVLHASACAAVAGARGVIPRVLDAPAAVVARFADDEGLPATPLRETRDAADRIGAALVLALGGWGSEVAAAAAQIAATRPHTVLVRDTEDVASRVAATLPADAVVVVRGPHAEISADDLLVLARSASDGPVAPLWLGWDGSVASAGTGVRNGRSYRLLAGFPREDAMALGPVVLSSEVDGTTYARPVAPSDRAARTLTDAVVRAPALPRASSRPVAGPDTDIAELVAPLGWVVEGWTSSGPRFRRLARDTALPGGRRSPSLRWAIKIAAPPGRPGEAWGDTHFARGIADALRRLGQEVVIDAYAARDRPSSALDEVVLALRGPEPLLPQPGAVSLLWVISHPDELDRDDVEGFDAVFAASESWARAKTREWERDVHPLLQCTDTERFRPHGTPRGDRYVFVGTSRGIARPSVVEPIRAGLPVDVYGPDWRGYIPPSTIVATHVPNSELPRLYEGARAVLNDHWPAMQRHGFVSNRLFDVVAAGGRAVSDQVDGIDALFSGAVATYETVPELLQTLSSDPDEMFPDPETLSLISERVRREHSFDARARTLLDAALQLRG